MTHNRHGFSLLELLISLAILAALSTVALRSTNSLQSQTRYQQTTRSLDEIRNAIVGPSNLRSPDGSVQVTGFVADTGRLPKVISSPFGPLGELMSQGTLPTFGVHSSNSDPSVSLRFGWQGPYLRFPVGNSLLTDGWGNSFQTRNGPGAFNIIGTPVSEIRSFCADNRADPPDDPLGGTDAYNLDVAAIIPTTGQGSANASFSGQVRMFDASNLTLITPSGTFAGTAVDVVVVYFAPLDNGTVIEVPVIADPLNNFTFSIPNVTIGPRALKAYVLTKGATFNSASVLAASTANYPTSPIVNVVGTGGNTQVPTLVLKYYAP